jgi:hypothetical protein
MPTITQHLISTRTALAACACVIVGGGAAWAASGGSTTIHACFSSHGGALRVAAHCKHGEKALSWSQTGPAGPAGAVGAAGAAGSAGSAGGEGAAGPSDIYASGSAVGALTTSYTTVGSFTLPPGSYLLEAQSGFFPTALAETMTCLLAEGFSPTKGELDSGGVTSSGSKETNLVLNGTLTISSPQFVGLFCKSSSEGNFDDAHLTAIKTANLHGSLPFD